MKNRFFLVFAVLLMAIFFLAAVVCPRKVLILQKQQ